VARKEEAMSNAAEIEAVLFKPTAGGYVFQAANPWVFGPMTRYVVSEAQKSELLAIIKPRRPVLWTTGIIAGILLWAASSPRSCGLSPVTTSPRRPISA
jgi:hypothetical protein